MTRAASAVFVLLCAAGYCDKTIASVIPSLAQPSDFSMYYQAAGNVAAGKSPFVTEGYIYPPLLAEALAPLARLSYVTARWAWFVISQACLLAAAWLMWRALGRDWIAACVVALVWALGGAATESLALGQPGPSLTLLLAIAMTGKGWKLNAAAAVGLAIKLIPGIVGILYLLRRQWRAFAVFAALSLLLLAVPWFLVVCCLDGPKIPEGSATSTGTPATLSWSLPSMAIRLSYPVKLDGPVPRDWELGNDLPHFNLDTWRKWVGITVSLAALLLGIFVLAKSGVRDGPMAMAALVALALAAAPVCWTHYQVMQYPGVAVLLCHAARSRRWRLFSGALGVSALLYPLPVAALTALYTRDGQWITGPTLFWTSAACLASAELFWLLAREARRPGA